MQIVRDGVTLEELKAMAAAGFGTLVNVGSEIERTISWRGRNARNSAAAFERGLELLDLTIADPRHRGRLRELVRVREALADSFAFDNRYGSTDESWRRYFHAFTYAVALRRGR